MYHTPQATISLQVSFMGFFHVDSTTLYQTLLDILFRILSFDTMFFCVMSV